MSIKTPAWLPRNIAFPAPLMLLCTNQSDFDEALSAIGANERCVYVKANGSHAETHWFTHDGETVALVCIKEHEGRSSLEVAALLVHEAVHVWQTYCDDIGEKYPGREQEAYGIQCIAYSLFEAFVESQVKPKQERVFADKLSHQASEQLKQEIQEMKVFDANNKWWGYK